MTRPAPLVRITDLRVRSGDHTVLDGVGLTVEPGECVGLVGPSGCGKTTTVLTILGHVRAGMTMVGGRVQVHGQDVLPRPPRELRGTTVAYLPQDPVHALNPYRRIGQMLVDSAASALPRRERPAFARRRLAQVGLPTDAQFLRRYPHQISGGQQQRLALALAISRRPELLILDEPTTGLDLVTKAELLAELRRVHGAGTALIWISHDPSMMDLLPGKALSMSAGRIDGSASPPPLSATRRSPTPPSGAAAMVVSGLRAGYQRVPVLRDLDLSVRAGELVAILGVSGAGKTTLARCLAGLHQPDKGTVCLDGTPLAANVRRRDRRHRAAVQMVAQSPAEALHPRQSVHTAIGRSLRLLAGIRSRTRVDEEVDRLLTTVRLDPRYARRLPEDLSGGERQRVAIARTLAADPRILICDESTAALDSHTATQILALLDDLRHGRGLSVVVITHDVDVAAVADRVAVLADGTIVTDGAPSSVLPRLTALLDGGCRQPDSPLLPANTQGW